MHQQIRRLAASAAAILTLTLVAACGTTGGAPTPIASATSDASDAPSEPTPSGPGGSGTAGAPAVGQTDTDWGTIWDEAPPAFPIYPGSTVAEDAGGEVVSGRWAIADGDPAEIASWMQAALETATYSTEALSGPLEDGSYVLDSVGDGDCRIEVGVKPLGGMTFVTARYGAACPNPGAS